MTSTEVANMALSHLGVSQEIANIDTDSSQEARTARRFFNVALENVLRDYDWPRAQRFLDLALVEEDPTTEWAYSYRYPSDCLELRRILSGIRNDNQDSRAPYKLGNDADGTLIYTDIEDATAQYTANVPIGVWPSDMATSLSFRLAVYMAPRLTGGDPFKLGEKAMQMYQIEAARAYANAKNEEQNERAPESEFVRYRDGSSTVSDDNNFE